MKLRFAILAVCAMVGLACALALYATRAGDGERVDDLAHAREDASRAGPRLAGRASDAPRELRRRASLTRGRPVERDLELHRGCVIEGTVVDASGRTVAGAPVVALHDWRGSRATTDSDGRFRFDALEAEEVYVRAGPRGWNLPTCPTHFDADEASALLRLSEPGSSVEVTLRIPRGQDVIGRVVTEAGVPVPGALVAFDVSCARGGEGPDIPLPPPMRTDARGRFAFRGIFGTSEAHLTASASGLVSERVRLDFLETTGTLETDLVVRARAAIAGHVVLADGSAPTAAWLESRGLAAVARLDATAASAPVDRAGDFRIDGLRAGAYEVELRGSAGALETISDPVELDWGETVEGVVVRLAPHLVTAGRVVDPRGAPISDLELRFGNYESVDATCVTAADGTYRVEGLSEGTYDVTFGDDDTRAMKRVRAGDQSVRLVHWILPHRFVEGRVLEPDGRPVVEATLFVSEEPVSMRPRLLARGEVRDGAFRVEFRCFGRKVQLSVYDPRDASGRGLQVLGVHRMVPVDEAGIEIRLAAGLAVSGRVVDDAGKAVSTVRVVVGPRASDVTGPDGRFRIQGLREGTIPVFLDPPRPYAERKVEKVEVGRQDLVLVVPRGWTLSGRVVDPEGAPVPGARLRAEWGGGAVSGTTDERGAFALRRLGDDTVGLDVRPGAQGETRGLLGRWVGEVTRADEAITLCLERGTFLKGVVVDEAGRPVKGADVNAEGRWADDGAAFRDHAETDRDGGFRLGPVPSGVPEVTLDASSIESHLGRSEAVRRTSPATGVRLVLPFRPVLRGRLLGTDVEGFGVYLWDDGRASEEYANVARDGTFVLERVRPGVRYTLYARRPGDSRCALARGVGVSEREVVLRLVEGKTLAGRVGVEVLDLPITRPDVDRFGPARVFLDLEGPHGVEAEAVVDLDGSFEVKGLPPGTYTLTLAHDTVDAEGRGMGLSAKVEGVEAGRRDVEIPLVVERGD